MYNKLYIIKSIIKILKYDLPNNNEKKKIIYQMICIIEIVYLKLIIMISEYKNHFVICIYLHMAYNSII